VIQAFEPGNLKSVDGPARRHRWTIYEPESTFDAFPPLIDQLEGERDMSKVVCVLYDDPIDGYPKAYPRDDIPKFDHYPDGQTLLGPDGEVGAQWVRSWFAPGQPFLAYPSTSNLRWLREAGFELEEAHDPAAIAADQACRIADAFGLFGPPERCAERLLQAREEAGIEDVFLFPAHDLARGYDMPVAEVQAFERVIRPRLGG